IRDFHVTGVQTCALPISPIVEHARRVLVTTGGGDVGALTPRVLNELNAIPEPRLRIRAIVGPLMPEQIRRAARIAAADSPHLVRSEERRVGQQWSRRMAL